MIKMLRVLLPSTAFGLWSCCSKRVAGAFKSNMRRLCEKASVASAWSTSRLPVRRHHLVLEVVVVVVVVYHYVYSTIYELSTLGDKEGNLVRKKHGKVAKEIHRPRLNWWSLSCENLCTNIKCNARLKPEQYWWFCHSVPVALSCNNRNLIIGKIAQQHTTTTLHCCRHSSTIRYRV